MRMVNMQAARAALRTSEVLLTMMKSEEADKLWNVICGRVSELEWVR